MLGDFLVLSIELGEHSAADTTRWAVLASATVNALSLEAAEAHRELLDELFATFVEHELLARIRRPFENGWPRVGWDTACVVRSAFEALRDLFERHTPALLPEADMSRIEQRMIQHGDTLYVPLPIPSNTPHHHWWWRGGAPASERRMQMNERMRDLLPPRGLYLSNAPPKFRALVSRGFAFEGDRLLFRDRIAPNLPVPLGRMHDTASEADTNVVRFADVFEPDASRRPVDTAATALACARHLAYELRRRYPPCRIVVNVHPSLNTIRFHQVREGQDWATKDGEQTSLDHYTSAMLVLDSE